MSERWDNISVTDARDVMTRLEDRYRREPARPEHLVELAQAYATFGRFNEATRRIITQALQYMPANATLQRALSVCYLVEQTNRLIQQVRDDPSQFSAERIAEQIGPIDRIVQRQPGAVDVVKVLADLELLSGRGYDALTRYEQAIRLGYNDGPSIGGIFRLAVERCGYSDDVLLHMTSLLEDIGAFEDALWITRRIVQTSTSEAYLLNLYIRQLERAIRESQDPAAVVTLRVELAQTLAKLNRLDEAVFHLREFAPGDVTKPALVKGIARLLIKAGDYRTAFDHLRNVPLDEEAKALVNEITLSLEQAGEIDTAVYLLQYINQHDQALREAIEIKERSLELDAELELGELAAKAERFGDAFEKYLDVIEAGYEPADAVLARIDAIIARIPISSYNALLQLGRYCINHQRHQQAISYLKRVLQVYPEEQEAMVLVRRAYDAILAKTPAIPEIRLKSAQLYRRMGEYEKAIREFEYCLEFPAIKDVSLRELAACYSQIGRDDEALGVFARLRIDEEDCEPLYHIYERLKENDVKRALEALNLIRRTNPQYRDIVTKIAALEERLRKADGRLIEDPKMKELIGNLAVGRYRYIGKIGSGGMGIVYKVFDMKNNCVVAMKVLRDGLQSSGKAIDRFYREARIAAKLNHRNIVNVFDYSINNIHGHSYITMEFVDGPSLRDLIEKKFAASIDVDVDDIAESLYYVSQLCDALYATHKEGIIHRDIKPDNILINSDGIVKVTDFGIVHVEEATFTPTGAMVGTPRYMSPEQIQGKRLDGRSDIYAAGIILYELLTGSPPFITGDISYQHVNMPPTPPRDICPAIPHGVNEVILRCLTKAVDDRYPDAMLLKLEIDRELEELNRDRSLSRDTNVFDTGIGHPTNAALDF